MGNEFSVSTSLWWILFACAGCGSNAAPATQVSAQRWQQLCLDTCAKAFGCDAGATGSCSADCAAAGQVAAETFTLPGCNQNQLVNDENACLELACTTYGSCIGSALATTGCSIDAGTEPDGAASSTSGDAGASCAVCDQAGTCCSALALLLGVADAGDGGDDCAQFTTASCNGAGAQSSAFAGNCELQLTVGRDYGAAACN